jgi:hypothetical protein
MAIAGAGRSIYQGAEKVLSCTFSESRASARSRQINDLRR